MAQVPSPTFHELLTHMTCFHSVAISVNIRNTSASYILSEARRKVPNDDPILQCCLELPVVEVQTKCTTFRTENKPKK